MNISAWKLFFSLHHFIEKKKIKCLLKNKARGKQNSISVALSRVHYQTFINMVLQLAILEEKFSRYYKNKYQR